MDGVDKLLLSIRHLDRTVMSYNQKDKTKNAQTLNKTIWVFHIHWRFEFLWPICFQLLSDSVDSQIRQVWACKTPASSPVGPSTFAFSGLVRICSLSVFCVTVYLCTFVFYFFVFYVFVCNCLLFSFCIQDFLHPLLFLQLPDQNRTH